MAVTKNQEYTVAIEGYSGEGAGVARIDGFVVFVSGALRGEVCRILILKVLKSAAFAKVLEVLAPSPHRIAPDCPYFPRCGGCTYRHMDYAEELALKRRRVQDNLARIGGSEVEVEEILGAAETRRYRNKAQYPVSPDGRVGFYRARTHEVIDTRECLLVKPEADAAAEAVRQYMRDFRAAGYDERTRRGLLRHVYVRSNTRGECLICLLVNGKRLPHEAELVERLRRACPKAVGIVLGENTRRDNVILGERYRTLWGADRLEDVLCGRVFRLSVPSFYQVNREQAERLYAKAIEYTQLTGEETVLDLYCGAGTITLALAPHAKRVLGAEIVPEAIDDARENAARSGVENAEFFCGDASDVAKKLAQENLRPDVITVDPPRKGLAEDVVESIARMQPERVVYVSCDSATMARDVKRFATLGYRAVRACAVDLFPRADHVETVVLLSHKKADSYIHIDVEFGEGEGKIPVDSIAKRAEAYKPKEKVTYKMIKEYIEAKYGFKVHTAYIAEVKRNLGLPMYDAPNAVEELKQPRKHPTPEKVEAIKDALRYFAVI
ncbi:MAG: 23S rRNA (uracil(1939)-C(5))-methyltransferase RlmD [Oscillospiraceae bacterium]